MATALDFVGDRWTILVLRELLGGPARFQDLKDGLPGIAPNLLSERLRRMESDGIVRRAGAMNRSVYTLTEVGAGVRTAIEELGLWGAKMGHVSSPRHPRSVRAIAMALQAILVRSGIAFEAENRTVELDVDGEPLEVAFGSNPHVVARASTQPDARASITSSDISAVLEGKVGAHAVLHHISGDEQATWVLADALD